MSMKTRFILFVLLAATLAGFKAAAQTPGIHSARKGDLGNNIQVITNITKETFITAVWSPTNAACWTDGDGNKWSAALTNGLSVWFSADAYPPLFGTATNEFPFIISPTTPPGEEGGLTLRGYISDGFHVIDGGSPLHKWKNATKNDFNYPLTLLPQGEAEGTATVGFAVRMATNRIDGIVFESNKNRIRDTATNLIWETVVSNGWTWLRPITNTVLTIQ